MNENQLGNNAETHFKKEDAYYTLEMINTWINNVDTKVSFAIAMLGVMLGFIFGKGTAKAFTAVSDITKLSKTNGGEVIGIMLVCILYLLSFISIIYLLLAILARVKVEAGGGSVFFFGTISSMNFEDYQQKVLNINEEDMIRDLEQQIHINSQICTKKMKYYNSGIRFLLATITVWFICSIFQLI